jgi:hypothetical protein
MDNLERLSRLDQIIPIKRELLRKHNFFELYPFDGGGSHINNEMIGTVDDAEFVRKILAEDVLGPWGKLPELDFAKLERWRSIEQSCWINRFYFIASLARHSWKTSDKSAAELVKQTILHFIKKYPAPKEIAEIEKHVHYVYDIRDNQYNKRTYEENQRDETNVQYLWFDFQPASRVLHILYALYFIKDLGVLSAEDVAVINKSLYEHSWLIYIEERNCLKLVKGDNHQSLRGLVLLYAGLYFKGVGEWKNFLEDGAKICRWHACEDFLEDGVLGEISPSYHCFETWHLRDAAVLLKQAGMDASKIELKLGKTVDFVQMLRQNDGRLPVINDGYALYADPFLDTVKEYQVAGGNKTARYYENAGIGVAKTNSDYLLFDASIFTGFDSHYHGGKGAFTYWVQDHPIFVDSGCCSYDHKLFADWYKKPQAHSSLLIDAKGDGEVHGLYNWQRYAEIKCDGWHEECQGFVISAAITSIVDTWKGVKWTRMLRLGDNGRLTIEDVVENVEDRQLCFVFNLHPDVCVHHKSENLMLENSVMLQMKYESETARQIELDKGYVFIGQEHRTNSRILVKLKGAEIVRLKTAIYEGVC